jgi:hypothetical protein
MYVSGGTVYMGGSTVTNNVAGGVPGLQLSLQGSQSSFGGGVDVSGGTVWLESNTVTDNVAIGASNAERGGIFIVFGATIYIYTYIFIEFNTPDNIHGVYQSLDESTAATA